MTVTTPLGQVHLDGEGMRLEFVRTYDISMEDVWSALTESDRVARWFGTWTGDPATGSVELLMTEPQSAPGGSGRVTFSVRTVFPVRSTKQLNHGDVAVNSEVAIHRLLGRLTVASLCRGGLVVALADPRERSGPSPPGREKRVWGRRESRLARGA